MVLKFLLNNIDTICPKDVPQFLEYKDSFQLLIMVILSAQTTDRQVNRIAPRLFKTYSNPYQMSQASLEDLEKLIFETGFYHSKAIFLKETSHMLVNGFSGIVPQTMEDLLQLKGVGRKTANVILGTLFNQPAIIVDTHFKRVCFRLGLTNSKNPEQIERDLKDKIPNQYQYRVSMWLNKLGRETCIARGRPICHKCVFKEVCPSSIEN